MTIPLRDLHDATLLHVALDWASGTATLDLRSTNRGDVSVIVRDCTDLLLPRHEAWGHSSSVLTARFVKDDASLGLQLDLQSGDQLTILGVVEIKEAVAFPAS